MKYLTGQRSLRTWHSLLGMLIAPSVIFFSVSGALQMLNFHESHAGYHAPSVLVDAAAIHKEQALPDGPGRDRSDEPAPHYSRQQAVLKGYWILVSMALIVSSLIGIVLALRNPRQRRSNLVSLILGTALPLALALV